MLYFILFRTRLAPRFISVWGFIGVTLIIVLNLVNLGNAGMILALPMILNEIFLGFYLIAKDFNRQVLDHSGLEYTL